METQLSKGTYGYEPENESQLGKYEISKEQYKNLKKSEKGQYIAIEQYLTTVTLLWLPLGNNKARGCKKRTIYKLNPVITYTNEIEKALSFSLGSVYEIITKIASDSTLIAQNKTALIKLAISKID